MDCVEQHEAKHLANAGHGVQQREGVRVMVCGRVDDGTFDVAKQGVLGGEERQINCDTLVDGGIGKALGHPLAVGFVGDRFAKSRQGILAVGMLDVRQELSPLVCPRHATPE
jgi:hypothetical protein